MIPTEQYRWYVVGCTLLNQALAVGIIVYSFALFVVPWLDEFGISRGYAMMAIFSFQVVVGLLSPTFGRMMDQYPMRWLVLIGGVLIAAGLVLISFATAFWQIILVYATFLAVGMILSGTLASQTMVSKWFVDKRGLGIGISAMGTSMGGFVFPVVSTYLILGWEWQGALVYLGIITLVLVIPFNFFVLKREPPEVVLDADGGAGIDGRSWTTAEILGSKNFWIPVAGLVPINAAFSGVQFNLGAYVADLGLDQEFAATLISVTALTMIGGKFFFGSMGDRVDHRRLYWLMAVLQLLALYSFTGRPGETELLVAACLLGLSVGGVMPMMGIMYASRFGTLSFGRVLGLVNMFLMAGGLGSVFAGWVFDVTRSYDMAFYAFGVLLLPCIVIMAFLAEPEPR